MTPHDYGPQETIDNQRQQRAEEDEAKNEPGPEPQAKVPRISRLMALAIKYQSMLDRGEVSGITELARLYHVTQARMSQILNLNSLSPAIQEHLLYLPKSDTGKTEIHEKMLRSVSCNINWQTQARLLVHLCSNFATR